jgi:hypothetical protein
MAWNQITQKKLAAVAWARGGGKSDLDSPVRGGGGGGELGDEGRGRGGDGKDRGGGDGEKDGEAEDGTTARGGTR